jgi:DNA-binding winged helix-turn-helix (wHTH) protein
VVGTIFEFGDFRLDCDRFGLYRAGHSLKLERKPMELLILLAGRNGHLVTRAEIAERLWDREVFVDTEHGINTAIRKIRQALGDDPEQPRFLLTITGKGYRFVGVTAIVPESLAEVDFQPTLAASGSAGFEHAIALVNDRPVQDSAANYTEPPTATRPPVRRSRPLMWLGACGVAAVLTFLVAVGLGPRSWRDRFLAHAAKPDIKSLAVLPLDNLSGDPGQSTLRMV